MLQPFVKILKNLFESSQKRKIWAFCPNSALLHQFYVKFRFLSHFSLKIVLNRVFSSISPLKAEFDFNSQLKPSIIDNKCFQYAITNVTQQLVTLQTTSYIIIPMLTFQVPSRPTLFLHPATTAILLKTIKRKEFQN